jgi:[acyl-carrier-protein] S-malonyltransferase
VGKIAFVFPGQGAQSVGMGSDACEHFEEATAIFNTADQVLEFSLSDLIFQGPDSELKKTYNTQPALLTTSIALLKVLQLKSDVKADFVAGHSLGEYSALVASGAMPFEDAVQTVRARGHFMEQAVPNGEGAMAAVLGAERTALSDLCQQITNEGHLVELANLNCPGQIVISGSESGVQAVVERGKEIGARRVLKLEVSGPFHSSMMRPAADQLDAHLAKVSLQNPMVPVVANVTAKPVQSADEIRQLLVQQVSSSVLWEDSVRYLVNAGVDTFIEIGPGNVLSGLIKKIAPDAYTVSLHSVEAIDAYVNEVKV